MVLGMTGVQGVGLEAAGQLRRRIRLAWERWQGCWRGLQGMRAAARPCGRCGAPHALPHCSVHQHTQTEAKFGVHSLDGMHDSLGHMQAALCISAHRVRQSAEVCGLRGMTGPVTCRLLSWLELCNSWVKRCWECAHGLPDMIVGESRQAASCIVKYRPGYDCRLRASAVCGRASHLLKDSAYVLLVVS